MRRFVVIGSSLLVLFVALLLGVRVAGAFTPQYGLADFTPDGCVPHPCWLGLQPGQTPLQTAATTLNGVGKAIGFDAYELCRPTEAGCWYANIYGASGARDTDTLREIRLVAPTGAVRLGDLLLRYGPPTSAMLCWLTTPSNGDVNLRISRPLVVGYVTFSGHVRVNVYHAVSPKRRRFNPHMLVDRLYFRVGPALSVPRWQGFRTHSTLGCGR